MLAKNTDLLINEKDPFKNDCLKREETVKDLTNLLQSTTQPFVISIEAPWGWGKTTFIKLWKAYLEQKNHPCLYFNAWSNDFAEDPLIAFLSEIGQLLEKEKNEGLINPAIHTAWNKAKRIGGEIIKKGLPLAVRLATQGIVDQQTTAAILQGTGDELGDFVGKLAEDRIAAYDREKQSIDAFRKSLEEFAKEVTKGENRKGPIVIFVDELDRCRPNYALALLERIKHLFNVDNVVFILAVDRMQLDSSVKAIYGIGIDADGYLRRFIDLSFRLPAPSTQDFCDYLFERFKFNEYFQERFKGARNRIDLNDPRELKTWFSELAKQFRLSLRLQEQCFTEINVILRSTGTEYLIFPNLLTFLVTLKAHRVDLYNELRKTNPNLLEWIEELRKLVSGSKFLEDNEPVITAYVLTNFSYNSESAAFSYYENIANGAKENAEKDPEVNRARRILSIINNITNRTSYSQAKALNNVLSRIENIGHLIK